MDLYVLLYLVVLMIILMDRTVQIAAIIELE
jgi:hypothetical protein